MIRFLLSWWQYMTARDMLVVGRVNRVGPESAPFMTQITLLGLLGFGLRLHVFYCADDGNFHDHPRAFISLVLRGSYRESFPDGSSRIARPGSVQIRSAECAHNVIPVTSPCVTVACVTPVIRQWRKWRVE